MLIAPLLFSFPPTPLRKSAKVLEGGRQKANQRLKAAYTKRGGHADLLRQTLQNTRLLSHQDSVNKTFNSCATLSLDGPALPGNNTQTTNRRPQISQATAAAARESK